jgi:hypothetical protein
LNIPPPSPDLFFPNVQLVIVGLLFEALYIPPPRPPKLSLNVQFVNAGLLPE